MCSRAACIQGLTRDIGNEIPAIPQLLFPLKDHIDVKNNDKRAATVIGCDYNKPVESSLLFKKVEIQK